MHFTCNFTSRTITHWFCLVWRSKYNWSVWTNLPAKTVKKRKFSPQATSKEEKVPIFSPWEESCGNNFRFGKIWRLRKLSPAETLRRSSTPAFYHFLRRNFRRRKKAEKRRWFACWVFRLISPLLTDEISCQKLIMITFLDSLYFVK